MLKSFKELIKTKPRIYDLLDSMRPIRGDLECWLDDFSRRRGGPVRFIQVGASDGLRWDPVRRFVIRDLWTGVLIEPLFPVYEMLVQNYSYVNKGQLFFENCIITNEKDASIDFWSYSKPFLDTLSLEDRLFYLRKSSVSREQVEAALRGSNHADDVISCYKTKSMALSDVIEKYFPHGEVDLVFIDAEGHDDHVVRTIDFQKSKPAAVVYEAHNLSKERGAAIEKFLVRHGYRLTRLGGDTVATMDE
jgi:hypothetical protein